MSKVDKAKVFCRCSSCDNEEFYVNSLGDLFCTKCFEKYCIEQLFKEVNIIEKGLEVEEV